MDNQRIQWFILVNKIIDIVKDECDEETSTKIMMRTFLALEKTFDTDEVLDLWKRD